jgi:CubicO group peptidase (beta-lactamase class C family)
MHGRAPGETIVAKILNRPVARLLGAIALAALPVACATIVSAQTAGEREAAAMQTDTKTMVEAAFPSAGPGAAVVVIRGGRVVYAGGRGLADLEAQRPITADTAFRLGSITKQFTAALVLQLVAEKRIALDDPLSRFFPDWPQPGARATVRQLLNHSSGLQDFTKIPGYMGSPPSLRPNSTADLLALTRSRPAVSEPGTRWEYNNGGYIVLGAIVEQVTGMAWHQAVTERIAKPLGLKSLAFAGAVEGSPNAARGYSLVDGQQRPARGVHISVAHAAGGLVASATDLARWAQALHHGNVVSPPLYREMISPARLADGSAEPYGFGLRLGSLRGQPAYAHGGSGRGLDSDSLYIPSQDLFVAVLANSDDPATDPGILTRRLAADALGQPIPSFTRAAVDKATIAPLFGAYSAADGPPRRFFARDGKLYLGRGDDEMEAFAAGEDRFFFGPDQLAWFRIIRSPTGAHVMEVHRAEAAAPDRGTRTGPVPAALAVPASVLQSYTGTYKTEGPVFTVALDPQGRLTISAPGQEPFALRPVSPTEFRVEGAPMRVVFHPEDGTVNRLTLHRGARELHGVRTGP